MSAAQSSARISNDVGDPKTGQRNDLCISVGREFHTLQILVHDVVEHALTMTDHHQFARSIGLIRVPP